VYQIKHDPTIFSQITEAYEEIVEYLLNTSDISEGQDLVYKFIGTYGESAFVCRYGSCTRSSKGFSSLKKRAQHEALHTKRLKCAESSCEFYISGFTTKGALQRHNRKYHPRIAQVEIPAIQSHENISADEPATPTPATPIIPIHPQIFNKNGQNGGGRNATDGQAAPAAVSAPPFAPLQPDPQNFFKFDDSTLVRISTRTQIIELTGMQFNMGMDFANPVMGTADVLQDFDFDSFLHQNGGDNSAFSFDPSFLAEEIPTVD
jgi:hypothetical protein